MSASHIQPKPASWLWGSLTSIRLTVFLLLILAGVAVIGTVVPQNQPHFTGAVWAETAWGRYWSWDPKETWSLITWFIYAALLHARLVKGWHGRRIAWLAVLGFMAVLFTYFGVSFLLNGLHSYLT
jgi:ABC-type uncharacterized transport system permease subunit